MGEEGGQRAGEGGGVECFDCTNDEHSHGDPRQVDATWAERWRRGRTELVVMPDELLARIFPTDHPLAAAAFAAGSTLPASAAPASAPRRDSLT